MHHLKSLGLIAALAFVLNGFGSTAGAQTPAPSLSPAAAEVVKLTTAGVGDDVVQAYIQSSAAPFNLGADGILYLKDLGLSAPVITAMLTRDSVLRGQTQPYVYDQQLYPAAGQPAPAPALTPAPEPAAPPPAELPPAPAYVANPPPEVNYFYDDLSPYGAWVQLEGVGLCWQPRAVILNREWRPYCDGGHWVDTDAGWFWQSDYSWGWAPFHYGRWHLHERCGWVWTPDTVWGPAWVTWRNTGDHWGWAPLPPHATFDLRLGYRFNGIRVGADFDFGLRPEHFTFVALRDFHDRDLGHRRMATAEVRNIYQHTTIINNYTVNNSTIVNRGVPVERVAAATHTEVKRVMIRDVPAGPGGGRPGVVKAGEGAVYRPQLRAPAAPRPIVAQKVDPGHPVIQHAPVAAPRVDHPYPVARPGSLPVMRQPASAPAAPAPRRTPAERPVSQAVRPNPVYAPRAPAPTAAPAPVPTPEPAPAPQGFRQVSRASEAQPAPSASRYSFPSPSLQPKEGHAWHGAIPPAAAPPPVYFTRTNSQPARPVQRRP